VVLELGMETGAFYDAGRPGVEITADDLLYVMYTSGECLLLIDWDRLLTRKGSTGMPKGVDVKHGTMATALLNDSRRMGMGVG
jgi:acyl-CoA synthetase (AMP-forming)/AMP-acid ligase II